MRDNLATDLADTLRQSIVDGQLATGDRINEVELAASLEVSRTPLREALYRLVAERLVESRPRQGFYVREIGPRELADVYGIRAILDPAALEAAGLPDPDRLDRLTAINDRIREAAADPERIIDLDDEWHLELLHGCPNRALVDLIREFMRRTRPLERAYMRDRGNVQTTVRIHDRILDALRAGDLDRAVELVRENMRVGLPPIVEWLEERRRAPVEAAP